MAKSKNELTPTDKKLREYYEKHSAMADDAHLHPVKMSFPKPRRLVALRLEEETLESVKRLAARKGLNYSTLMRMWITERLRREDIGAARYDSGH